MKDIIIARMNRMLSIFIKRNPNYMRYGFKNPIKCAYCHKKACVQERSFFQNTGKTIEIWKCENCKKQKTFVYCMHVNPKK